MISLDRNMHVNARMQSPNADMLSGRILPFLRIWWVAELSFAIECGVFVPIYGDRHPFPFLLFAKLAAKTQRKRKVATRR